MGRRMSSIAGAMGLNIIQEIACDVYIEDLKRDDYVASGVYTQEEELEKAAFKKETETYIIKRINVLNLHYLAGLIAHLCRQGRSALEPVTTYFLMLLTQAKIGANCQQSLVLIRADRTCRDVANGWFQILVSFTCAVWAALSTINVVA